MGLRRVGRTMLLAVALTVAHPVFADSAPVALPVTADDVIPTANDWIALPSIRARDGAIDNFNVLSMRYRGLLEASGPKDTPLIAPFLSIDGERRPFSRLDWTLQGYWVPTGTMRADEIEARLTWVTPPGYRVAILRMTLTNHRKAPVAVGLGGVGGLRKSVARRRPQLGGDEARDLRAGDAYRRAHDARRAVGQGHAGVRLWRRRRRL